MKNPTQSRLRSIGFKNYRSFNSHTVIDIKPMTLLFGGNSSGKSSILKLFSYLSESISQKSWGQKGKIAVADLVYQKKVGNEFLLEFDTELKFETDVNHNGKKTHHKRYKLSLTFELIDVYSSMMDLLDGGYIGYFPDFDRAQQFELAEKKLTLTEFDVPDSDKNIHLLDFEFVVNQGFVIVKNGFFNLDTPLALTRLKKALNRQEPYNIEAIVTEFPDLLQIFNSDNIPDLAGEPVRQICHEMDLSGGDTLMNNYSSGHDRMFKYEETVFNTLDGLFDVITGTFGGLLPKSQTIHLQETNTQYNRNKKHCERKDFQHLTLIGGNLLHNILTIFSDAFDTSNLIHITGIRNILTDTSTLKNFTGIIGFDNSMGPLSGIRETINRYLGKDGINSSYIIRQHEGLNPEETAALYEKLNSKGFNTDTLRNFLDVASYKKRFELFDKSTQTVVSGSEVGLGIVQVLPILANMANSNNSLIIIEQPELHLHPAQQSKLAGIILTNIRTHNNTFIIETHSEHFIKMVQLEIAKAASGLQKTIEREKVQILYVEKDEAVAGSRVREIALNEDGALAEPWPDSFFDASADITIERLRLTNRN